MRSRSEVFDGGDPLPQKIKPNNPAPALPPLNRFDHSSQNIGHIFRAHRILAGISQTTLSEMIGTCSDAINDIENGNTVPSDVQWQRMVASI